MFIDFHLVAFVGLAATMLLVAIAEFAPWRRLARGAARTAIALSLVSCTSWCYAIYKKGYIFPPDATQHFARKRGGGDSVIADWGGGKGGGSVRVMGRSGGSGELGGDDERAEEDAGGWGRVLMQGRARGAGDDASFLESLWPSRSGARKKRPGDIDGEIKRDCEGCPEMVVIAGGVSLIGAPDSDANATAPERPQRRVKLWPGFAISRSPILAREFNDFLRETGERRRNCDGAGEPHSAVATCMTSEDAGGYALWLSKRTGYQFKVPTAIEWEFAARTRGVTIVAAQGEAALVAPLDGIGRDLAEMTSDCFDPYLPSQGRERRAWGTAPHLCEDRVLKGARPGEDTVHARFSARRPWRYDAADPGVGFRVVRGLN